MVHLLLWLLLGPVGALAQCNPATSVADPRVGVVDWPGTAGSSCFFPFTYGGLVFYDCDGSYCDGSFCGYWCSTSCNYPSDYAAWRFCKFLVADLAKPNCSGLANISASADIEVYGGTGSGTSCYFPFMYNNVCYDDCIVTTPGGDPWCATTDVMYHVSSNQRFCRSTRKGLGDPSCSKLNSSAPVYLPRQIGNYSRTLVQSDPNGNCTFPFYYKEKCYDDCTTVDAQAWDLPWCLTEKYYDPNKKMRVCPYYRKYKEVDGLALSWGFFYVRQHDSCASSAAACNTSWSLASSAVPLTSAGSGRMALSSLMAEPIEVMPQPNGFFILKLPQNCSANWKSVSIDGSDVSAEPITIEREFWNIKATATPGVYTVQSMRNSTRGMYLSYTTLSGNLVLSLSSGSATQWRFDQLSDISMATFGLPCENPTKLNGSWCEWSAYVPSGSMSTRNRSCACPPAIGGLPCDGNSTETEFVVNGTWCEWSAYSLSGGYSTRTRECNCSAPAFGGTVCPGGSNETGFLVNGSWCEWSAYNVSSDGYGLRTRKCNCSAPAFGGAGCTGPSNEAGLAANGSWCNWSPFSSAGAGYSSRTRACNCSAPAFGGADCPGASNDTGVLVNGAWCDWSPYNVNGSYGTRTRECNCSAPAFGGAECPGSSIDSGLTVNGTWCDWSPFSISGGLGTRSRACNCSAAQYGGASCPGTANETGLAVNGSWCAWSPFSFNGSHGARIRACNCSAPEFGGAQCPGSDSDVGPTVSGAWCDWSPFTLSGSYGTRSRACNCTAPTYGGSDCSGTANETGLTSDGSWCEWAPFTVSGSTGTRSRLCNCTGPVFGGGSCPGPSIDTGAVVNGIWCAWTSYSGNGSHETRTRQCNCSAPAYGGSACTGSGAQSGSIVAGVWCSWSAWAADAAAAVGALTRSRTCSCPSPSNLGADCSGQTTESSSCTTASCVPYAQPQEPGQPGASFTSLDAYGRLVAWAIIICLSMVACTAVGLGLMIHHIGHAGSAVGTAPPLPPIFSDYDSYYSYPA